MYTVLKYHFSGCGHEIVLLLRQRGEESLLQPEKGGIDNIPKKAEQRLLRETMYTLNEFFLKKQSEGNHSVKNCRKS